MLASWMPRRRLATLSLLASMTVCSCDSGKNGTRDDWTAVEFDSVEAAVLRAAAAYDEPLAIRERFPQITYVATVPQTDVQVFVETLEQDHLQWIGVRGTADLENALQDVEWEKVEDPALGIFLHQGMATDARRCLDVVRPQLRKDLRVHVTGHSLGGAIAALLAAWLEHEGFDVARTITFGQPMLTNEQGAKSLEHIGVLRVVDAEDVVPLLPAPTLVSIEHGEYRQFGPELMLEDPPHFRFLKRHDADAKAATDFWLHLGRESLKDHHVALYGSKVAACAKEQARSSE